MKSKIIFLMLCVCVCFSSLSYAHPPSSIQLSYDGELKEITAVFLHAVSNPATHWIDEVEVSLNGEVVLKHMISRQDENRQQTVRYHIPDAKVGDVLSIKGTCSISGSLTEKLTIEN